MYNNLHECPHCEQEIDLEALYREELDENGNSHCPHCGEAVNVYAEEITVYCVEAA